MLGLTSLGVIHTAISLVALFSGIYALVRDHEITSANTLGKIYILTTVLTCVTGFGIFQHGGFGKPHALGVLTLLVLALTAIPGGKRRFGERWHYFVTVSFTLTLFFHFVPGITETFTRIPIGAPIFNSPEDPALEKVVGATLLAFIVIMGLQVMRLRRGHQADRHVKWLAGRR